MGSHSFGIGNGLDEFALSIVVAGQGGGAVNPERTVGQEVDLIGERAVGDGLFKGDGLDVGGSVDVNVPDCCAVGDTDAVGTEAG